MPLLLREEKSVPLTHAEMDENLRVLRDDPITALAGHTGAPNPHPQYAMLVTYTLATTPGYGITPESTVADYTALLAYTPAGNGYVEVEATGTYTGEIEIFHWSGTLWRGPYPAAIKNPQYEIGSNNEDILIVTAPNAALSIDPSNHPIFSLLPALTVPYGPGQQRMRVLRTASATPIFAPTAASKVTQVINARPNEDDWLCILNLSNTETENNVYGPDGTSTSSGSNLIIAGAGSSMSVVHAGGNTLVVRPMAGGFADTPGMNNSSDAGGNDYLTTSTLKGVMEWEYKSLNGRVSSPVDDAGTVTFEIKDRESVFQYGLAGVRTFAFSGAPANRITCFTMELSNGGSAAITWPALTHWAGGVAPTLTAAGKDILEFYTSDGTNWFGFVAALDIKVP